MTTVTGQRANAILQQLIQSTAAAIDQIHKARAYNCSLNDFQLLLASATQCLENGTNAIQELKYYHSIVRAKHVLGVTEYDNYLTQPTEMQSAFNASIQLAQAIFDLCQCSSSSNPKMVETIQTTKSVVYDKYREIVKMAMLVELNVPNFPYYLWENSEQISAEVYCMIPRPFRESKFDVKMRTDPSVIPEYPADCSLVCPDTSNGQLVVKFAKELLRRGKNSQKLIKEETFRKHRTTKKFEGDKAVAKFDSKVFGLKSLVYVTENSIRYVFHTVLAMCPNHLICRESCIKNECAIEEISVEERNHFLPVLLKDPLGSQGIAFDAFQWYGCPDEPYVERSKLSIAINRFFICVTGCARPLNIQQQEYFLRRLGPARHASGKYALNQLRENIPGFAYSLWEFIFKVSIAVRNYFAQEWDEFEGLITFMSRENASDEMRRNGPQTLMLRASETFPGTLVILYAATNDIFGCPLSEADYGNTLKADRGLARLLSKMKPEEIHSHVKWIYPNIDFKAFCNVSNDLPHVRCVPKGYVMKPGTASPELKGFSAANQVFLPQQGSMLTNGESGFPQELNSAVMQGPEQTEFPNTFCPNSNAQVFAETPFGVSHWLGAVHPQLWSPSDGSPENFPNDTFMAMDDGSDANQLNDVDVGFGSYDV